MGRKSTVESFNMFKDADISTNATSEVVNTLRQDKASIHISWSGSTAVGTITVEARNGENDSWYEINMGGTISVSGVSGDHQLLFNELPFTDVRLQYTSTSGTGNINAYLTMKVTGA